MLPDQPTPGPLKGFPTSPVIAQLPARGLLGPAALSALCGLPFDGPDLTILMRHRAVQLGMIGTLLLYAALRPARRPLALTVGVILVAPPGNERPTAPWW